MRDLQDGRGFDRFDVDQAGFFGIETVQVGYPIVFCCKLDIEFLACLIDGIHSETTGKDKGEMAADFPLLQDKSPALYPTLGKGC